MFRRMRHPARGHIEEREERIEDQVVETMAAIAPHQGIFKSAWYASRTPGRWPPIMRNE